MSNVRINDHSNEYMDDVQRALTAALDAVGSFISDEAADELGINFFD